MPRFLHPAHNNYQRGGANLGRPRGAGGGKFLGNDGSAGRRAQDIFRVHVQTLTADTTIGATENAMCAGPLTIEDGVTLTIESGGTLVIV